MKLTKGFFKVILQFIVLLSAIVISISGCIKYEEKPGGQEIPFKTIEQAKISGQGGYFDGTSPSLILIMGTPIIDDMDKLFTIDAERNLKNINFSKEIVLVVFQGWKGSLEHEITIRKITFQDNTVLIYSDVTEPTPGMEEHPMETSPYHLVRLDKSLFSGKEIIFKLIIKNEVVYSEKQKFE